jgi:ferrous iron transport protein A
MLDPSTPVDLGGPAVEPTLDQIPSGGRVRVRSVVGVDPIARRLGDLGIRAGVEIEVRRRAPLGDPTLFELCGYQLCLRRTESARIRVQQLLEKTG